jgi:type IV secretory pathway protease TraF
LAELENLFALQDKNYREFHARLMPNIEKERIIGIRVPVLRKYAKELARGSRLFL